MLECQNAVVELERANAVLTSKCAALEQEAARARAATKSAIAARGEAEQARGVADSERVQAEAQRDEQLAACEKLRRQLEQAALAQQEAEVRLLKSSQAGERCDEAQQRVGELEKMLSRQRASHKQVLVTPNSETPARRIPNRQQPPALTYDPCAWNSHL